MEPLTMLLLGAGSQAAGSLIGELLSGPQREAALREIARVKGPEFARLVAERVGDTSGSIQGDVQGKNAQSDALRSLQEISSQGGMDAQAKLGMAQARDQASQDAQAQRMALQAEAARRGGSTPGMDLLMRQRAGMGASNRNYLGGLQEAAAASQRQLAATQGMAGLGGQMRGQGLDETSRRQAARQAIDMFNSGQALQAGMANNQFAGQRAGFDMNKAGMLANARMGQAQQTGRTAEHFGNAFGGGLASGANYLQKQKAPGQTSGQNQGFNWQQFMSMLGGMP